MVKKTVITLSTSLALIISAPYAYAISIIMEEGFNGERMRITQPNTDQKIQSIRVSPNVLFIQVDNTANTAIQQPTNTTGELINNIVPNNEGFSVELENPNFGFIQSQDSNGDILIDIYPDNLGARWRATPTSNEIYNRLESTKTLPFQNAQAQKQVTPQINTTGNQPTSNKPVERQPTPVNNFQTAQGSGQITATTPPSTVQTPVNTPVSTSSVTPAVSISSATPSVSTPIAATTPISSVPTPAQTPVKPTPPASPASTSSIDYSTTTQVTETTLPSFGQTTVTPSASTAPIQTSIEQTFTQEQQKPLSNNTNIINKQLSDNQQTIVSPVDSTKITLQERTLNEIAPQEMTTGSSTNTSTQVKQDLTDITNRDLATSAEQESDEPGDEIGTGDDFTGNNEEIDKNPPTSFSFSLSDKTSNEAVAVVPKDVIAQRKKAVADAALNSASKSVNGENAQGINEKANPESPAQEDFSQEISNIPLEKDDSDNAEVKPPLVGEILYVDEAGNPVPAPLNIPQTLKDMRQGIRDSLFEESLKAADLLKDKPLPIDLLEEVLYARLQSLFVINSHTLKEKGVDIISAANEALNANPNSENIPEALFALALTSLALDHTDQAQAHVDTLHRRYPNDADTPISILYLANHYLAKGEFVKASHYLTILIEDYPTSVFAQEAALLQTKSLHKQGDLKKTMTFIDFMDRRWNKLYLTEPEYFSIRADVEEAYKNYQTSISTYWLMYNLDPKGKDSDFALHKIGNLYHELGQKDDARSVLEELVKSFPESKYRAAALLNIGENGRYNENISLEEIFNLLNEPNPLLPSPYYNQIISEYPNSNEAKYAKLRLAAQLLWEKNYTAAAEAALDFYNKNLPSPEADRALEILLQAVAPTMSLSISEKNYEQTLSLWEKYPPIQKMYTPYEAPMRMALGRALLNRKQEKEGEEMLAPFMEKEPKSQEEFENGLYAYTITLANALNKQDWNKVLETTAKIENWDLPKDIGLQRLYSTALAAENIGLSARSLPIWQALAPNKEVPLYQRAYAQYFLARDAERRQNLREAYQANLDTLAMFEDLKTQQSPYADDERTRESVAALMDITEIAGRYTESLQWLSNYRRFVPAESPDYAGLQLREARLYKKMGDNTRWRSILEQIKKKEPESVFGKMAQSELNTFKMARDLNRFAGQN